MNEKLSQFVDHAREKGLDHTTIRHLLLSAGWREQDIAEVFCARDLELPIPEPTGVMPGSRPKSSGRVAQAARKHRPAMTIRFFNFASQHSCPAWERR